MASSGYVAWSVIAGETPTTSKWNLLGSNDASFNAGLGFNDGVIVSRHIATGLQLNDKILNPYKFAAYKSASGQTITTSVSQIIYDVEEFDTGNNFASNTFTAPIAGFYFFTALMHVTAANANALYMRLYKNGSVYKENGYLVQTSANINASISALMQLSVSDTVDIRAFVNANSTVSVAGAPYNNFAGFLVSAT